MSEIYKQFIIARPTARYFCISKMHMWMDLKQPEVWTVWILLFLLTSDFNVLYLCIWIYNWIKLWHGPNVNNSRVTVLKSIYVKDDIGHFTSSEQHVDGCIWLARHDFILAFYSDLSLAKTADDLQVVKNGRSLTLKNIKNGARNISDTAKTILSAITGWKVEHLAHVKSEVICLPS